MIKFLKKHFYWLLCSFILLGVLLVVFIKVENNYLRFSVTHNAHTAEISLHEFYDDNYHVYLPAYTDLNEVTVSLSPGTKASIGGIDLYNGMSCRDFALETPYDLILDGQYKNKVLFYQSANVATMYINTISGNMDHIHEAYDNTESAAVSLISHSGDFEHLELMASVKGRGNATWGHPKRPYTLTFSQKTELAGMGAADKWILLANATDETNLHNKLVLDVAEQVGLGWVPEHIYTDVYLNGTYNGLYLLIEKPEVGSSRLNLDSNNGFLCKVDLEDRWSKLDNPYKTGMGRTLEISSPQNPTDVQLSEIHSAIAHLEQILSSGSDLSKEAAFDLDSWVKRYLIDEISGNIDSDIASSYFYYDNGIFHAGPVWDYDMAFGNSRRNQNPTAFIAKNSTKGATLFSPYYDALYHNESFYHRMTELYQKEFLPILEHMLDTDIPNLVSELSAASKMNSLRWCEMYPQLQSMEPNNVHTAQGLLTYLETRMDFLSRAWIENEDFCTVQFEVTTEDGYWNTSVKPGTVLETDYLDTENTLWLDKSTGKPVDLKEPIQTDMVLTQQFEPQQVAPYYEEETDLAVYITYLSIGAIVLVFLGLILVDYRHRHTGRRAAHADKRNRVSP